MPSCPSQKVTLIIPAPVLGSDPSRGSPASCKGCWECQNMRGDLLSANSSVILSNRAL